MSIGQQLTQLDLLLDRLLADFHRIEQEVMAAGGRPSSHSFARYELEAKIDQAMGRLAIIFKELKSARSTLNFRSQIAKKYSRDFRYRARQSIKEYEHLEQRVYAKAVELQSVLRGLCGPTDAETLKALLDFAKDIDGFVGKGQQIEVLVSEVLSDQHGAIGKPDGPVAIGGFQIVMATIIMLYALWKKS